METKKRRVKTPEEKLLALMAEKEKLAAARVEQNKKEKAVEAKIAAAEREYHDGIVKRIDVICKKNNINLNDVAVLLETAAENNILIEDIISMIGK